MKWISGVWFAFTLGSLSFLVFVFNQDLHWQACACWGVWFSAFSVKPQLASLLMLFLSPFAFVFSASNWIKQQLDLSILYGLAQMSPMYQGLKVFSDPWSGTWAYVDSPFHYAAEDVEIGLACIPLLFILFVMLISAIYRAKS